MLFTGRKEIAMAREVEWGAPEWEWTAPEHEWF